MTFEELEKISAESAQYINAISVMIAEHEKRLEEIELLSKKNKNGFTEIKALAKRNEELLFQVLGGIQALTDAVKLHQQRLEKLENFDSRL